MLTRNLMLSILLFIGQKASAQDCHSLTPFPADVSAIEISEKKQNDGLKFKRWNSQIREFLNAGGTGEVIRYLERTNDGKPTDFYGFYLVVKSFPKSGEIFGSCGRLNREI